MHGDKYDYSLVEYKGAWNKVKIKCNKIFEMRARLHLDGQNCPNCYPKSKGENEIKNLLIKYNIEYVSEQRFKECRDKKLLPFDFYLPKYNVCIEYQGPQHYLEGFNFYLFKTKNNQLMAKQLFEKQLKHDQIKRDYCKEHNILLYEITYKDNIEQKLNELLNLLETEK